MLTATRDQLLRMRVPPTLPNLIIGGTNKAGTTSVFRYLAAHPQTCASSVKEPRFFSHHPNPSSAEALLEYSAHFRQCKSGCPIVFEASPQYLAGGLIVARRIHATIPEIRLVFVLRDPADRLMSFYNSYANRRDSIVPNLSPDQFVDRVLATADLIQERLDPQDAQLQRELFRGRYFPQLTDYLSVFTAERMLILFFEDLTANPQLVMRKLSAFAGLNSEFYANFDFTVENKTRRYRSTTLNRLVRAANLRFEPGLNRLPALRRTLRRFYSAVNERKRDRTSSFDAIARLNAYYGPYCRKLRVLLEREWPGIKLPDWLAHLDAPRAQ